MKVEIGTVKVCMAALFLFWEYLFQIFGIGSLQGKREKHKCNKDTFVSEY
jgi:hypothetical protein